ncbi:hypothetical protein FKX85_17315 [Echinicola soli]|uniref:Glycine zipper family protein n=1 Tax=Echinicola soli TaxID=2591634 RepID=A0A514CLX9_9BACT|nr:hypothetical protein [Echinicola soli]QDH80704.1 hypothetical protein FKX85_17315 [Echinicola soli]
MKKAMLTLVIVLSVSVLCCAQRIESHKVFGGYQYTQNGQHISFKHMTKAMESNPRAFDLIKKARTSNTFASIVGFAGGALIGWPIGAALGGGEPNWALAGIGAGLIVVTIPISSSANKKTHQAVDIYNSAFNSGTSFKPELNFITNQNGIGLAMVF